MSSLEDDRAASFAAPRIADDNAAYSEAIARAEAAAGITRDAAGNEVYVEETPVATPELDGAVPIAASDQPLTPEPAAVEAADTPELQQQEAPVVPPTLDELQSKLAVAEARLEEKDSFIGRQSGEVGELRQAVEELQKQIQAQPVAPQVPEPFVEITQDLIDANPARAVQAAFKQRDEPALQVAFEAWKEIDPFTAATWLADRKLEQQKQAFDEQIAVTQRQLEAVATPAAEAAAEAVTQRQWKDAFDEVKAKHADIFVADPETGTTVAERLITAAGTQPEYAAFREMLQNGDAPAKAAALSALYALEKVGNPEAFKAQLAADAQDAATEAADALRAAGVVTGQTTAGQGTEARTAEELEQDSYIARSRSKPSLSKGWTGRT
jgi:hypothetical protein